MSTSMTPPLLSPSLFPFDCSELKRQLEILPSEESTLRRIEILESELLAAKFEIATLQVQTQAEVPVKASFFQIPITLEVAKGDLRSLFKATVKSTRREELVARYQNANFKRGTSIHEIVQDIKILLSPDLRKGVKKLIRQKHSTYHY